MAHDVQRPIFAGANQGGQGGGDDFDLNEIFADYFSNEFENPMDAYTGGVANHGGGAVAVANTGGGFGQTFPPSGGGVRTAFHTAQPMQQQQHQQPMQQQHQVQMMQQMQQTQHIQHAPPIAKRPKIDGPMPGGLTSRLGVSMPFQGGNGAQQMVDPHGLSQNPAVSGISLPVGVGIRLGGAGGVAPSTAQTAARAGSQGYLPWGGQQTAGMSDQAIAERRQRNREHAKRSRVRKKFMLESLQEEVSSLQVENQRLRTLIQDNIPEHAQQIISDCCEENALFGDEGKTEDEKKSTLLVRSDFQLMESLTSGQQNFVLSDPRLPDNPIVFATPGFYKLTGYTQEQVLGRNCRFLQGPGTSPKTVDIIRKAVATGADCTVCILNYKADGSPFWNQFFVAALRDSDNCIVNYVGVQTEVEPDYGANALEDRVNAVLPLQAKEDGDDDEDD